MKCTVAKTVTMLTVLCNSDMSCSFTTVMPTYIKLHDIIICIYHCYSKALVVAVNSL